MTRIIRMRGSRFCDRVDTHVWPTLIGHIVPSILKITDLMCKGLVKDIFSAVLLNLISM